MRQDPPNTQDRELRLAAARASLRECWERAEAAGLDTLSGEEIDREIAEVRAELFARRSSVPR